MSRSDRETKILELAVRKRRQETRQTATSAAAPEYHLPYTITLTLQYREGSNDFHTDGDMLREVVCGNGEHFDRFSVSCGESLERPGLVLTSVSEADAPQGTSNTTITITLTGHQSLPVECSWRSGSSYHSDAHSSNDFNMSHVERITPGSTPQTVRVERKRSL